MRNTFRGEQFFGDDEIAPIIEEEKVEEVLHSPVSLSATEVQLDPPSDFLQEQNQRFRRYMEQYKKTLTGLVVEFRQEPSAARVQEKLKEKLHQYSLNFLDFTTETMQQMYDWDEEQTKKATYLLYAHAVQPHEAFLMDTLGKSESEMADAASEEEHWRAQQFDAVYNAGKQSRENNTSLLTELGEVPALMSKEHVSGKTVFLNQAGWYATEATFAFAQEVLPSDLQETASEFLLELFSLSDEELQDIVAQPDTPADVLKAQIILFAVQAANLTWIQTQPFRAAVFGELKRVDPEEFTYFMPFFALSDVKGWPAILLDKDQILQGVRLKEAKEESQVAA